jgi:glycerol-3-phosphate O-acyltransferase/dihydroxyacetone phosphate acyltransferase
MSWIYKALKIFLRQITGNYFRNIHVDHVENMPQEGPTILCCNHSNQFMDAMLLISHCPRPLSFCFAASSFSKPIVGYLAKKINVIPVNRAEDLKMNGRGKISMLSDIDIKGFGTKFISDANKNKNFKLGVHALLIMKKYRLMVEKVLDEENIKVRSDPKTFELIKKEYKDKQLNYQLIPKLDNSLMFKETTKKLMEGKAICIFPEGTSHDNTHLLKLKPGVAYIALEAMANYGVKNIKLISCGLSYFSRDEFRSDLILKFGIPIEIPESLANTFKVNKKQAIDLLLKVVETQMKSIILTAPTYQEYMLIKMLRNLYVPNYMELPAEKSSDYARWISHIYNEKRDSNETKEIKAKVEKYMFSLEQLGIEDSDLMEISLNYSLLRKQFFFSLIIFLVNLIFLFPMLFISLPLLFWVHSTAEFERNKSVQKNPNKILGKDVVSSVKVVTFVKFLPLVGLTWVNICNYFVNYYLFPITKQKYAIINMIVIGVISFMFYGYLSINVVDYLKYHFKIMKTIFYYFIVPKGFENLRIMRKNLTKDVKEFFAKNIKNTQFENTNITYEINNNERLQI